MNDNQQTQSNGQQPVDQQALDLTHAIALQESGGGTMTPNYNAVGDNGTSHGAYQWQPGNFEADAKDAGLDPTDFSPQNQDKVAYAKVLKYKQEGKDPGQIASLWNSGSPNNWQNHSGTTVINGKSISYDTPAYVKGVQSYYQKLQGSQNAPGIGNLPSAAQQTPFSVDTTGNNAQPSSSSQPESLWQKAGDVAKGVGNFLFPIVGDIGADIQGKSTKTALQQAGDAALSVLPFIPGLGEAGEAVKGGEAAVEGGEAAIDAAKGSGVLSKIMGSTVAKGAGVGYGAGVASNLSQGQGIGQAFTPNLNNIGGAVLGGAAPAVMKGASSAFDALSGIDPAIKNELTKMGSEANPEDLPLMDKYNQAAKVHATNVRTPSVENIAAGNLDTAADKITQNTQVAGKAVGAAKQAATTIPLQDASKVAQDFANEVKERYGLEITSDTQGNINLNPVAGRARQIDPNDISRIKSVAQQLNILGKGATVGQATDILSNVSDDLARSKGIYGQSVSPIDQLFTKTSSDLNDVVRKSAPDLASANDRYSGLKGLQEEVRQMAGNKLQRGELLMNRIGGNRAQDSLELFDKIKAETGIDLTKHAVLAKNAIANYGSSADKSALAKMLGEVAKGNSSLTSHAIGLVGSGIKKLANPGRISRNLLKGDTGLLGRISPYVTKAAIESGSRSGIKTP